MTAVSDTTREIHRAHSRLRQRASRRLVALHQEEFARLFHEAKHEAGVSHTHGPDDPETIDWWGPQP